MPRKNILLAMFDILPTKKSANFIFSQIRRELNLQAKKAEVLESKKSKTIIEKPKNLSEENYWEELITKLPQRPDFPQKYELTTFSKSAILKELERTMSESIDVNAELASVGGRIHEQILSKPQTKFTKHENVDYIEPDGGVLDDEDLKNFWNSIGVERGLNVDPMTESIMPEAESNEPTQTILAGDAHQHSPASREIEIWLENLQKNRQLFSSSQSKVKQKTRTMFRIKPKWS